MDVVCDLSIGGRGLGCIGNIAILAGVALAAAGCGLYCACFRARAAGDRGSQHTKADEAWSRAALAAAAAGGGDGLDVGDVEIADE